MRLYLLEKMFPGEDARQLWEHYLHLQFYHWLYLHKRMNEFGHPEDAPEPLSRGRLAARTT